MCTLILSIIGFCILPQFAFACSDADPNYRLGVIIVLSSLFSMFLAYLAWKKHPVPFILFGFIFVVWLMTYPSC